MKKLIAMMMLLLPMLAMGQGHIPQHKATTTSLGRSVALKDSVILVGEFTPRGVGVIALATHNALREIALNVEFYGLSDDVCNEELQGLVKLNNNEVFAISGKDNGVFSKEKSPSGGYRYHTRVLYPLMEKRIEEILSNGIKKIRLEHDGGFVDVEISPEQSAYLVESIKFLQETVAKRRGFFDDF